MALKVVLSEAMSICYNGNLAVVNAIPLVRRLLIQKISMLLMTDPSNML